MKDYKDYRLGTKQEREREDELFGSILSNLVLAIFILLSLALCLTIEWV